LAFIWAAWQEEPARSGPIPALNIEVFFRFSVSSRYSKNRLMQEWIEWPSRIKGSAFTDVEKRFKKKNTIGLIYDD
jgi:hypothetical protein